MRCIAAVAAATAMTALSAPAAEAGVGPGDVAARPTPVARPQDPARVAEIAAMLRPEAGFAETRAGNRAFWDRIAATGQGAAVVAAARRTAAASIPVPDDSRYAEYGVWTRPLQQCRANLDQLARAECIEGTGEFLPKIAEYLDMFSTRRTWTGRFHDRDCLSFNGRIHIVELGNGQIAQTVAVVLDALRGLLPEDVRERAVAALRRHCLDTYLAIARDPEITAVAKANNCSFLNRGNNWNAACCQYMVAAALHALDDPSERAEALELAERSTEFFLAGYSEDGLCLEGASYWSYGFGQYLRLALWTRRATGSFLSFATPFAKKAFASSYGTAYCDAGGPSFGDCNIGSAASVQHLGALVWPEFDRFDADGAGFMVPSICDFTLRFEEFRDPEAFLARTLRPYPYPERSWFPDALALLVCRPAAGGGPGGIYAAIQGGCNERSHGHHDAGSYSIAIGGVEVMGDPGNSEYTTNTFGAARYDNPMRNSWGHPVPKVGGRLQSGGAQSRGTVAGASFSPDLDRVEYDMRAAYAGVPNLASLTRTLEYDRRAGRVAVTDRVAFDGEGEFETALVTFGPVRDLGGGQYVFSDRGGTVAAKCSVEVSGASWHMETEPLPEEAGSQFDGRKLGRPIRAAIILDGTVHEAEVRVTWEAPAPERIVPQVGEKKHDGDD